MDILIYMLYLIILSSVFPSIRLRFNFHHIFIYEADMLINNLYHVIHFTLRKEQQHGASRVAPHFVPLLHSSHTESKTSEKEKSRGVRRSTYYNCKIR